MPALEPLTATRIVATPAALDATVWPPNTFPLRTAQDEVLLLHAPSMPIRESEPNPLPPSAIRESVTKSVADLSVSDPHAIIQPEGSYMGLWLPVNEARGFLARTCAWELPAAQPTLAQGAVANIPVKLWLERERVLFIVQAPFAADFLERFK